jgi:hypothetical protein
MRRVATAGESASRGDDVAALQDGWNRRSLDGGWREIALFGDGA